MRHFAHGELRAELERLATTCFRPPGAECTRTYSVLTLERWYYAAKEHEISSRVVDRALIKRRPPRGASWSSSAA